MRYLLMIWLLATAVAAEEIEVDVELVLAVDVSRSMQPWELELQREGYAEALASDEVWAAIERGLLQRIAVTYVEWAGSLSQRVVIPWTLVESRADLRELARRLTAHFDPSLRRTSISSAILFGAESLSNNDYKGLRRVIDISGDGPNNQGALVQVSRDRAVAQGITINGLPLMTHNPDEPFARWGIPDLDAYYRNCVIGGAGAFVLPVTEWAHFPDAVRRKLILEIAGSGTPVWKVAGSGPYNCRIGEEIWERNRSLWSLP